MGSVQFMFSSYMASITYGFGILQGVDKKYWPTGSPPPKKNADMATHTLLGGRGAYYQYPITGEFVSLLFLVT